MSTGLFTDLAWLPTPPPDFSARCRAVIEAPDRDIELRRLACFALDENGLNRLAKAVSKVEPSFRLGLLSNATSDFLASAITGTSPRYGLFVESVKPDYGQVLQEALSPESRINREPTDAVLLALDYRALPLRCTLGNRAEADATVSGALEFLATIRKGLKAAQPRRVCIVQTIAPPPERLFGSLDRQLPGTLRNLIERINSGIAESVFATDDVVLDIAGLAETVGLGDWHSPTQWNLAKLPFSNTCLPLYADHVCRVLAALRGKSRRCLVLDLDNTVWGGVIGDDGVEGIQCAQGDATGEAFLSVQQLALELRERGIVLAVSSKNNDEVARQPFQQHPEMLLREHHIAVFQANWKDKATNIKAIAQELSLGLDAMVLLDDNPAERALVRQLLPQVAVPELPADPALYARTLAAAGYFEAVIFSDEDVKRAAYYQDNAKRVNLQKQAGDLEAYLESLNMEITFSPFDATGRSRIAQLINKSNQYNLTTRRYSEADVAAIERDPNCFTLQARLADTFGDNGMISVVICRRSSFDTWEIDTWLMSCRVLGRRVENMVLLELLRHAHSQGIARLRGRYIPTERNQLVADHYSKLEFTECGQNEWELKVDAAQVKSAPMRVRSVGFDLVEA